MVIERKMQFCETLGITAESHRFLRRAHTRWQDDRYYQELDPEAIEDPLMVSDRVDDLYLPPLLRYLRSIGFEPTLRTSLRNSNYFCGGSIYPSWRGLVRYRATYTGALIAVCVEVGVEPITRIFGTDPERV